MSRGIGEFISELRTHGTVHDEINSAVYKRNCVYDITQPDVDAPKKSVHAGTENNKDALGHFGHDVHTDN